MDTLDDKKQSASEIPSTSSKKLFQSIKEELSGRIESAKLRASGLFDSKWYLNRWPDVRKASFDPALHFCRFGWKEGRNPNPYFDVAFYEAQMPECDRGLINPLLHYLRKGEESGLQ